MTRGGKRKGAVGRPRMQGETRTANLCGVRIKPSRLEAYKDFARANGLSLTRFIEMTMDLKVAEMQRSDPGAVGQDLEWAHGELDLDAIYASYVKPQRKEKKL